MMEERKQSKRVEETNKLPVVMSRQDGKPFEEIKFGGQQSVWLIYYRLNAVEPQDMSLMACLMTNGVEITAIPRFELKETKSEMYLGKISLGEDQAVSVRVFSSDPNRSGTVKLDGFKLRFVTREETEMPIPVGDTIVSRPLDPSASSKDYALFGPV